MKTIAESSGIFRMIFSFKKIGIIFIVKGRFGARGGDMILSLAKGAGSIASFYLIWIPAFAGMTINKESYKFF
jgi:hypothetical protein